MSPEHKEEEGSLLPVGASSLLDIFSLSLL